MEVEQRDIEGEKLLYLADKRWMELFASQIETFFSPCTRRKRFIGRFQQTEWNWIFFIATTIKRIILQGEREKVLDTVREFMQIYCFVISEIRAPLAHSAIQKKVQRRELAPKAVKKHIKCDLKFFFAHVIHNSRDNSTELSCLWWFLLKPLLKCSQLSINELNLKIV